MGVINLLDDLTINKIAAGEVIERPASVVKEMLENSIDAGAKNVTVEVKDGGISQIKITDDGKGLAEDDLDMAFERHATSKIRSADDLINVTSMGFRGEALASIAAISNVEMVSKRAEDTMAHKIVIEGGKVLMTGEAARSTGTTITVNKLFFNTPVRYKFLKKNFTEASYTEDVITRIALVNPGVAIRYINNGKTVIQTNGNGDLTDVVYAIYGRDVANEVIEVNFEFEDYKVVGVVGTPTIARSNRANQLFFVNGRYIKDKSLSAAAEKAYKGIIPVGRFGFLILNIIMDTRDVDVNVHPAKLEVRFHDESKVFKSVYHAIRSGIGKTGILENVPEDSDFALSSMKTEDEKTDVTYEAPKAPETAEVPETSEEKTLYETAKPNDESLKEGIDKLEEKAEEIKNAFDEFESYGEREKKGFHGLFKNFKKNNDFDEENNLVFDIYKSRLNKTAPKIIDYSSDNEEEVVESKLGEIMNTSSEEKVEVPKVEETVEEKPEIVEEKSEVKEEKPIEFNKVVVEDTKVEEKPIEDSYVGTTISHVYSNIEEKKEEPEVKEEENKKDDLLQGTFISNLSSDMEREIASRISNVEKQISNITQEIKTETTEEVEPEVVTKPEAEVVEEKVEEKIEASADVPAEEEKIGVEATEEKQEEVINEVEEKEEIKEEVPEETEEKSKDEIEISIPDLRGRTNKELNSEEVSNMIAKMKADIRSKIETYPELKFDRDKEVSKAISNISGEEELAPEMSEEDKEKIRQAKDEIAEEYKNLSKVSDTPDEIKEPTISMEGVKIPTETQILDAVKLEDRTQFVSTAEVKQALQTYNEEVTADTLAIESQNVKKNISETKEVGEVNKEINVLESETAVVNPVKPSMSTEEKVESTETKPDTSDAGRGFTELAKDLVESKFDLDSTQSIDTAKIREALKDSSLNPEFDKMYKETFGVDTVNVRREKEIEDLEKEKLNASNTLSEVSNENMSVFADEEYAEEESENPENNAYPKTNYKKLGIAFDKYILIEVKNEIFMVDSVVASEKVLFDSLRERYYSENDDRQELLIPDVINLTTKQVYIARESREMLNKAGFEFEEFGENTIKLTSVPEICERLNTKKLFGNILDGLENIAVIDIEEKEQKFIATIAATVVDNEIIELDEENADKILDELFMLENPLEAFDGKNVALKMSKDDMEKRFSRK